MEGRTLEITVDFVLQARAKMSDNKVNGPDDAIVSEMIKQLPLDKIYTVTTCFQERFMGQMESPTSWKNREIDGVSKLMEGGEVGLLVKPRCCPGKRDQKLQGNCADISDVEVVCILYYSSLEKGKRA